MIIVSQNTEHRSSVVYVGRTSQMSALYTKIWSFRNLKKGWHYGDGGPSPEDVVKAALHLVSYLCEWGLTDIDAFAGDSGEILLSAIHGEHAIDVIVEIDGTISVAYDKNDVQRSHKPHLKKIEARTYIAKLARGIWNLSAGFTAIGLTQERIGSPVWPLETPATAGVYQSQNATVYSGSIIHQETK